MTALVVIIAIFFLFRSGILSNLIPQLPPQTTIPVPQPIATVTPGIFQVPPSQVTPILASPGGSGSGSGTGGPGVVTVLQTAVAPAVPVPVTVPNMGTPMSVIGAFAKNASGSNGSSIAFPKYNFVRGRIIT